MLTGEDVFTRRSTAGGIIVLGSSTISDSTAAKQSVEKVGLLHVKHMAMRMLLLNDLQRAGVIVIERIAGSMNPADMLTKPLSAPDFVKCKGRIPGIYWGDDENENDASKENEAEVQMIEMMETNPAEVYGKKAQFRDTLLYPRVQLVNVQSLRWRA